MSDRSQSDAQPRDAALADGHHVARGAAANSLVLLAANFRGIFTFLVARLLGETAVGRFGLALLTAEILSKAGTLGLDSSVTPLVARSAAVGDGEEARRIFRRAIRLGTAASVVLMVLSIISLPAISRWAGSDAFTQAGALMMLALPGIAVSRISVAASRGMLSMRNEFYSRGLTETWVTTGAFLAALALGFRDAAPVLAVVTGISASAVVAFLVAWRALRVRPSTGTAESLPGLLRFSLPTAGSNLLNVTVTQADVLLLSLFVGRVPGITLEGVGVYWMAAQVAIQLRKVRQIFDPILTPVVATRAAQSNDRTALMQTVAAPGRWTLAVQLPFVGALVLSGGVILSIYGPGFREGALWLALLGLAHGTNLFAGMVETLFLIARPSLNLVNAAITAGVQVAAGLILIPRFGITGAAITMCISFLTQGVLRFAEMRHVFGWTWPWQSLTRPVLAFVVAFVPAALIRVSTSGLMMEATAGVLFLLIYAGTWWVIGAEPSDRELWARVKRSPWGLPGDSSRE
jgi:O-antigen/teichoic acid export membrane protein